MGKQVAIEIGFLLFPAPGALARHPSPVTEFQKLEK
jgi:hypothetical protein